MHRRGTRHRQKKYAHGGGDDRRRSFVEGMALRCRTVCGTESTQLLQWLRFRSFVFVSFPPSTFSFATGERGDQLCTLLMRLLSLMP